MPLYAAVVFLSALLLFLVQPLIGKAILPWFGGTPAVWTTCMLAFQVLLLGGYAYAHGLIRGRGRVVPAVVHVGLLLAAVCSLPILPDESWKPSGPEAPTWRILALLATTIGLPYFALSTTGPLLQAWFAREFPGRSPYRLYALSNVGSLLALLSYPLLVEPYLSVGAQSAAWSLGFVVLAGLCGWCAVRSARRSTTHTSLAAVADSPSAHAAEAAPSTADARSARRDVAFWLALSTCGSVLLLATTNQLCQEVAVVPFLWIAPLALYLLTFVLVFDADGWYRRETMLKRLAATSAAAWVVLGQGPALPIWLQIGVYCAALFVGCMICHGELAASRPEPRRLTGYFLTSAVGGALGGVLVAIVAPLVFASYWEYHLALAAAAGLAVVAVYRSRTAQEAPRQLLWAWGTLAAGVIVCGVTVGKDLTDRDRVLAASRNFYGVLRVAERPHDPAGPVRTLAHGRIVHGLQIADPERCMQPTAYYGPASGVGLALRFAPARLVSGGAEPRGLRVGVVGLGIGTLAAYGRAGDTFDFYEINPDVERLARRHFTFLGESRAASRVILGDARIQLERAVAGLDYDLLVVDAFSGDAIPMHLLTRECFQHYLRHLTPQGVLALHISNHNVDLTPVVAGLVEQFGYHLAAVSDSGQASEGTLTSDWLLVTRDGQWFERPELSRSVQLVEPARARRVVWTDDFGSLRQVLKH